MDEVETMIEWRKARDTLADVTTQLGEPADLDALVAFTKLSEDVAAKSRAVLDARATEAG